MGLGEQLIQKMDDLLRGNYDPRDADQLATWIEDNFRIKMARTPRGQKQLKMNAAHLLYELAQRGRAGPVRVVTRPGEAIEWKYQTDPEWLERIKGYVSEVWAKVKPLVPNLVRYFSNEGVTNVPKEIKSGPVTYLNWVGLSDKKLKQFVKSLDSIWGSIKGWRRKALEGGLTVALAGPREFGGGTAAGKYKSGKDILMVRATPKVLKRTPGRYGSPDYILVHELAHRYEWKHPLRENFEYPSWYTTPYSMQTGQDSFAELFALGHFGITEAHRKWDPAIQDKFENVMTGKGRAAAQRVAARWVGLTSGK